MTERPIIFTGPMVRAILEGRKNQTRRVVKFRPDFQPGGERCRLGDVDSNGVIDSKVTHLGPCVYHTGWAWQTERHWCNCQPATYAPPAMDGDLLYVRETWRVSDAAENEVTYRADGSTVRFLDETLPGTWWDRNRDGWRPSVHLPKIRSRLWLRVTDVRVERVQEITEADAKAEGVVSNEERFGFKDQSIVNKYRWQFIRLWNSIYAKKPGCSWTDDPWTWVVTFERCEAPPQSSEEA